MKVLRVVSDLYPFVSGGVGLHAYEMSRLQNKNKEIDLTVLSYSKGKHKFPFKTIFLKEPLRLFGNPIDLKYLVKLWKIWDKYDVIHAHSHLFLTTNMAALVKKFKKKPLVITNHGLYSQSLPKWFQKIYLATVGNFTFNQADIILSYTKEERDELLQLGLPRDKLRVIHNGIDVKKFYPKKKRPKNKFVILWIGRFVAGKNIEGLSNIIHGLKDKNFKFVIVGDGPLKDGFLDNLKKDKVDFEYHSFIENKKLNNLYNSADLFILPSFYEGFPRTIMEAMSCGLPVVTSNLPQLMNMVKNCGYTIQPANSKKFVEAGVRLHSDAGKMRLFGKNAREKVLKTYDFRDTSKKTAEVYKWLMS